MSAHNRLRGVYAITRDGMDTAEMLRYSAAILQGGASILQYRDKSNDSTKRKAEACALRDLCTRYQATFIVNDDVELACMVAADGVHLGAHDLSYAEARAKLGDRPIVGLSCYNQLGCAERAHLYGADYVAFGCFFRSSTKPLTTRAEPDLLQHKLPLPICAIGGITLENAPQLIRYQPDMLAVSGALYRSSSPGHDARVLASLFNLD